MADEGFDDRKFSGHQGSWLTLAIICSIGFMQIVVTMSRMVRLTKVLEQVPYIDVRICEAETYQLTW